MPRRQRPAYSLLTVLLLLSLLGVAVSGLLFFITQSVHTSASMIERSLDVPDGTTTPTRSREPKSTYGSITARCEVSRRLLYTLVTRPIGMPET